MTRLMTHAEVIDRLIPIVLANRLPGEIFQISYGTRWGEAPKLRLAWNEREFSFEDMDAYKVFAMLDFIEQEMAAHYAQMTDTHQREQED